MSHRAVLVLGGIRSGKSGFAESFVGTAAEVRYMATGAPAGDDPSWAQRLAAHRERRPSTWQTEELGGEPHRLAGLLGEVKPDQVVLVDDLGGWLTAVLDQAGWQPAAATEPVRALAEAVRACAGRVVVVSPEVGLSVVPATDAGRVFADALGTANQALADACDGVVLVIAGQPTWLKRAVPGARIVPVGATTAVRPPAAPIVAAAPVLGDDDNTPLPVGPGHPLPIPDSAVAAEAEAAARQLDAPGNGLGELAEVVSFVAGARGTVNPGPFQAVRVVYVHGDHEGGFAAGTDPAASARQLARLASGEGRLGLLAGQVGASLQLADAAAMGLTAAGPAELRDVAAPADIDTALRYGWRLAESAVDSGTDLLVLAAGGAGQEAAAVAVISTATNSEAPANLPPVRVAGGRYDDEAWMLRCAALRDAMYRTRSTARMPQGMATTLGGVDLAVAAGVVLGAAARRTPVLIDGPVGAAAALIARDLAIESRLWLLLADDGGHAGVQMAASLLGVTPVTQLKLGLGEGTGALTVLPLIQSALLMTSVDAIPAAPADPDATPAEPARASDEPDAASDEPGAAAPAEPGSASDEPGSASDEPGSASDEPGSASDEPGPAPDEADPVGA